MDWWDVLTIVAVIVVAAVVWWAVGKWVTETWDDEDPPGGGYQPDGRKWR